MFKERHEKVCVKNKKRFLAYLKNIANNNLKKFC